MGEKKKCGKGGWGWWMRNKIWRGGWYLGCDGNISRLFSSFLSCTFVSFLRSSPLGPGSWECSVGRSSQISRWPHPEGLGLFIPRTTSGSVGLCWQGRLQWMGIITVSLQLGTGRNETSTDCPEETVQPLVLLLNAIKNTFSYIRV